MTADDNVECNETTQKIRNILVMPSADILLAKHAGLNDATKDLINFVDMKIIECRKMIKESSPVVFTANSLQTRAVPMELSVYLTKIYQELGVSKTDEFKTKTTELLCGTDCAPQTAEAVKQMDDCLSKWDTFLQEIDQQLDNVVGPTKTHRLDPAEGIALKNKAKSVKSSSLISYIHDSPYDMVFIAVIMSFANPDTAEYIMNVYQKQNEFHSHGCDILLLTKGTVTDGGGFLKLIGIPFRMLLNEQEAMARLLQHRVSAFTLAGSKALHLFAEIGCGDDSLKMDGEQKDGENAIDVDLDLAIAGGSALVNREGKVLYSFVGKEPKDWPNVDTVFEHVKKNSKVLPAPKSDDPKPDQVEVVPSREDTATSAASKCCVIL